MTRSHNKKRNIGLIYELLLRHVSSELIEGRTSKAQIALDILQKRFDRNTEIYKEFRLFNALAKSTVSDTSVAAAILAEAKSAARRFNPDKLNKEKSLLIRDINYKINNDEFYYRKIPEYKIYATIQNLLNDWRKKDFSNLSKMVQSEGKVIDWLLLEKEIKEVEDHVTEDVDSLVVKIMKEKFNQKYGDQLNEEQRDLIKAYIFSLSQGKGESIKERLSEMKGDTLDNLSDLEESTDNQTLLEKINSVKDKIKNEKIEEVNDQTISRFLIISQLKRELMESSDVR